MRVSINCRVSTEAWRCDVPKANETERWSYSVFGPKWADSRIFGTVLRCQGLYFIVKCDIDGEEIALLPDHIQLEDKNLPHQEILCGESSKAVSEQSPEETISESEEVHQEPSLEETISESEEEHQQQSAEHKNLPHEEVLCAGPSKTVSQQSADETVSESEEVHQEPSPEETISESEKEWYYLKDQKDNIFIGELVETSPGETVHGSVIQIGEATFLIRKIVYPDWSEFDSDIHCIGSFIKWKTKAMLKYSDAHTKTCKNARKKKKSKKISSDIKTHNAHNTEIFTESEDEVQEQVDSSVIKTDELQIKTLDDLKSSQLVSLFIHTEHVGDGTYFEETYNDGVLPDKITIYMANVNKRYKSIYTIGNKYEWNINDVRKKHNARTGTIKRKKEWKKKEVKRLKQSGKSCVKEY